MKETDIAYVAGIIDADGYIGVKKSKPSPKSGRIHHSYHERIQVRMVDEPAIKFITDMFGGNYYREKPSAVKGKPLYCYQASDLKAFTILKIVFPYLRIKKHQAGVCFLLRQHKKLPYKEIRVGSTIIVNGRWGHYKTTRYCFSPEAINYRDSLWLKCKEFNRVGI